MARQERSSSEAEAMEPKEAVERAETIFDEAMAEALALFKQAAGVNDWPAVLQSLREIASVVSAAGVRMASYAGVASRQIRRQQGRNE